MLRAFERLARDSAMSGPTVLLAETVDPNLVAMRAVLRRQRVPVIQLQDIARAAHYLAVRETPLMIVVAASPGWASGAVAAARHVCGAPIVVAGITPTPDQLTELLESGANLVIDSGSDEQAIRARVAGLYDAVGQEVRATVRWLECAGLRVDLTSRVCTLDERTVRLSRMEYQLLVFLMRRAQQAVPPIEIVGRVWQWGSSDAFNTLRIHVGRLRRKLADSAQEPRFIASDRANGYRFLLPVTELADDPGPAATGQLEAVLEARLRSMYAILRAASTDVTLDQLGRQVTDAVVSSDHCDTASIFRNDAEGPRSRLIASTGMSAAWNAAMQHGHALDSQFVGTHAAQVREVVQVADIAVAAKRFPATATLLTADQLRSCLVAPLIVNGRVWGDIGFTKRQPSAFTRHQSAYLRAVADMVALRMSTAGPA